jgi:putrescine transport system permease protein
MVYAIARAAEAWRNPLLMLVILPFWTSFLIRIYAFKTNGLINNLWLAAGTLRRDKKLPPAAMTP